MSQFGIIPLNRIGIGFTHRHLIASPVIEQPTISIESVAVVPFGFWSVIYHSLNGLLGAFPYDCKAQKASRLSIYMGEDIDFVFLSPIKVNNSSISASFTFSGTGGSPSFAVYALIHADIVL